MEWDANKILIFTHAKSTHGSILVYGSQNIFGVFCDGTIQENHNGRAANKYLT
jgi:hypothetical protein